MATKLSRSLNTMSRSVDTVASMIQGLQARARASQKYKSRLSLERGGYGPHTGNPISGAERARRFRERRKADAARNFSAAANLASTSTTGIPVLMDVTNERTIDISIGSATELRDLNISRSEAMQNHWRSADKRFKTVFEANPFGLSCSVCDRLWFERDLKKVKHRNISFLQTKFPDENVTEFRLCSTCSKSIDANKIPTLSRSNGFRYPPKPRGLPLLDPISIRLISPRLQFMQIRRLLYEGNYGIVCQQVITPHLNIVHICPSTSSELPVRVSAAGGSAIYRNLQSSTNCSEIIVNANKSCGNSVLRKHNVGDICLVDVKVEDLTLFILDAVYIHLKASAEAVKLCLYQSLLPYSANLTKLIPNSQPDLETPIVLCGDFNCDPQQNSYLVEFMRNEFGLNYVQTSPTTLGNTTIDCTFTRNINFDIMPYVSYFTYHRPMLNKIVVEY
ncbi:uncharacterized protein TNCV_3068671 [Trichonephila clavipes]|nr:uncharacterized protein TNCV_3068671 [Trichonephila clavipes]